MAHILAFVVIALIKIISWGIIKSRLFIVAIPITIVMIFFKELYDKNEYIFEVLGIVLIVIVLISWVITLFNYLKTRKHNRSAVQSWAYKRYNVCN